MSRVFEVVWFLPLVLCVTASMLIQPDAHSHTAFALMGGVFAFLVPYILGRSFLFLKPKRKLQAFGGGVTVQWKQKIYTGLVDKFDSKKRMHRVTYNDGDTRWYQLTLQSEFPHEITENYCYFVNSHGTHRVRIDKLDVPLGEFDELSVFCVLCVLCVFCMFCAF